MADGRPKSWQFLATPTAGQTVFQSWQESGSVPAGYGTWITGTGTGFDAITSTPSMKYYDPAIGANGIWTGINNTAISINDKRGYMLYVRGDRTVTTASGTANPTTLRTKGTLYQPANPPPVTNVLAGKLAAVGNPYASTIDLVYMKNNGLFVNLNNDVTVWDPLLTGSYNSGGYQSLSAANNYEPTAGNTPSSYYPAGVPSSTIQSGQAFFVRSAGLAGSVSFTEACKVNTNRLVNRPPSTLSGRRYFRTTLYTSAGLIADGNAVIFDQAFRNDIDADDTYKIENAGENFGLLRNGQSLAVEARHAIDLRDTVFFNMNNLRRQKYQLRFAPKNMQAVGLSAFFIDRFLGTSAPISLTDSTVITFRVTVDPASAFSERFYVILVNGRNSLMYSNVTYRTGRDKKKHNVQGL
ncbi:MAG: hypothetical protein WKI04_14755 [Ferruginibacter sp.]